MGLNIPYTKFELQAALIGMEESEELFSKLNAVADKFSMEEEINDKALFHTRIAEHNGVTVSELVASPNYKTLAEEYVLTKLENIQKAFVEEAGITDKEAWALVAMANGILD